MISDAAPGTRMPLKSRMKMKAISADEDRDQHGGAGRAPRTEPAPGGSRRPVSDRRAGHVSVLGFG